MAKIGPAVRNGRMPSFGMSRRTTTIDMNMIVAGIGRKPRPVWNGVQPCTFCWYCAMK